MTGKTLTQSDTQTALPPSHHVLPCHRDAATAPEKGFVADVIAGLSKTPKRVSSQHLYDERGSALFDEICQLPEYYLTRSEQAIMRANMREIAREIGPQALLVELGSGNSRKTRLLLNYLKNPQAYLPIDISENHLLATSQRLRQEYPALEVEPIVSDFTRKVDIPPRFAGQRICVYFPGSTIGNFSYDEAISLLQLIADCCGNDGGLLIGFDLQKDKSVLEAAYNDSEGVTAAFSLNLLHRLNQEANATFDVDQFRHVAFYNPRMERIEIYLESKQDQIVRVGDTVIPFAQRERIHTEYSHKYTIGGFSAMAVEAGLIPKNVWVDDRAYFAVMYLEPRGDSPLSDAFSDRL